MPGTRRSRFLSILQGGVLAAGLSMTAGLAGCQTGGPTPGDAAANGADSDAAAADRPAAPPDVRPVGAPADGRFESRLAAGERALDQARWLDAAGVFSAILQEAPGHPQAKAGYERAMTFLNEGSTIDDAARRIRLMRQATIAEFDALAEQSREQLGEYQFASALGTILRAKTKLDNNRQFLTAPEYETRAATARDLIAKIERTEELYAQINR